MCDLLESSRSPPGQTLQKCLRKVYKSMQKIKACYVGMRPYTDHELARMMVMDGCFILEFVSSAKEQNNLLLVQISKDLLLVENQIPLFVLEYIFKCTILKSNPCASLTSHIEPLLQYAHRCLFKGKVQTPDAWAHVTDHVHDHILSLFHKCYQIELTLSSETTPLICNVVELEKAGVSFKPNEDQKSWSLAIKIDWWYAWFPWFAWFWVKPTLRIPVLNIEDNTETILRNIIAYEQTTQVVKYFTSYALAIDDLVDGAQDIAKLVESKVIINGLGSNEVAANMINKVGKNVISSNFYNSEWKELENYYNGYWPRNVARLRRTYFNNPWNSIALIAGIILFVLTMTQTYFTIKPTK